MTPASLAAECVAGAGAVRLPYNHRVDYRFKYRRTRAEPHESAEEERVERDRLKRMRGLAIGVSIPMTLVAGPLVGWLVGSWLDRMLGTGYWMVILIVLGTAAGFVAMIEALIVLGRQQ